MHYKTKKMRYNIYMNKITDEFENKKDYIDSHFLNRINYLMMYFGYNKAETARKANIARSTFYKYLDGEPPAKLALSKLANAFNTTMDVFAQRDFIISDFNKELMVFNNKQCVWNDNDNGFTVSNVFIQQIFDPTQEDQTFAINANIFNQSTEYASKSTVGDEPFVNTTKVLDNIVNQSYKKIYGDKGSHRVIFYSDDQFYELLNSLIETFEQNPDDKGEIFYKTYNFAKKLNKEYPNLEKEQKNNKKNM